MKRAALERSTAVAVPAGAAVPVDSFPAERTDEASVAASEAYAGVARPAESLAALAAATPETLLERLNASLSGKVVVDASTTQVSREQYRKLAASLHQSQAVSNLKVVMIASAAVGEGKSLTSANLALTLSESYKRRVLLIDGDLRQPSLHTFFGVDGSSGLSEGLVASHDRKFPVHEVSPFLTILPAGRPSVDPMAGLTSERVQRLIDEARARFDWVIVDTPPVGLLPDGHLLSSMVDAVVLVVKARETPYPLVQKAIESLGRERILGVVLNQAADSGAHAYYSYKYRYDSRPEIAGP
jgi:capsular exopolysaccharide synthesis family protein